MLCRVREAQAEIAGAICGYVVQKHGVVVFVGVDMGAEVVFLEVAGGRREDRAMR